MINKMPRMEPSTPKIKEANDDEVIICGVVPGKRRNNKSDKAGERGIKNESLWNSPSRPKDVDPNLKREISDDDPRLNHDSVGERIEISDISTPMESTAYATAADSEEMNNNDVKFLVKSERLDPYSAAARSNPVSIKRETAMKTEPNSLEDFEYLPRTFHELPVVAGKNSPTDAPTVEALIADASPSLRIIASLVLAIKRVFLNLLWESKLAAKTKLLKMEDLESRVSNILKDLGAQFKLKVTSRKNAKVFQVKKEGILVDATKHGVKTSLLFDDIEVCYVRHGSKKAGQEKGKRVVYAHFILKLLNTAYVQLENHGSTLTDDTNQPSLRCCSLESIDAFPGALRFDKLCGKAELEAKPYEWECIEHMMSARLKKGWVVKKSQALPCSTMCRLCADFSDLSTSPRRFSFGRYDRRFKTEPRGDIHERLKRIQDAQTRDDYDAAARSDHPVEMESPTSSSPRRSRRVSESSSRSEDSSRHGDRERKIRERANESSPGSEDSSSLGGRHECNTPKRPGESSSRSDDYPRGKEYERFRDSHIRERVNETSSKRSDDSRNEKRERKNHRECAKESSRRDSSPRKKVHERERKVKREKRLDEEERSSSRDSDGNGERDGQRDGVKEIGSPSSIKAEPRSYYSQYSPQSSEKSLSIKPRSLNHSPQSTERRSPSSIKAEPSSYSSIRSPSPERDSSREKKHECKRERIDRSRDYRRDSRQSSPASFEGGYKSSRESDKYGKGDENRVADRHGVKKVMEKRRSPASEEKELKYRHSSEYRRK